MSSPLKVVICAGQSNMVGTGSTIRALRPTLRDGVRHCLNWAHPGWEPLRPTPSKRFPNGDYGPELNLISRLRARIAEPIGVIKRAVSGTHLYGDWSPDPPTGMMLDSLLEAIGLARKDRRLEFLGFVWMQGERDCREQHMASAYASKLTGLIARLRQACSNPELPIVVGQVSPPRTQRYAYRELVRQAQRICSDPVYRCVHCDDLPKHEDDLHYDDAGLQELGRRFADALLQLHGYNVTQRYCRRTETQH